MSWFGLAPAPPPPLTVAEAATALADAMLDSGTLLIIELVTLPLKVAAALLSATLFTLPSALLSAPTLLAVVAAALFAPALLVAAKPHAVGLRWFAAGLWRWAGVMALALPLIARYAWCLCFHVKLRGRSTSDIEFVSAWLRLHVYYAPKVLAKLLTLRGAYSKYAQYLIGIGMLPNLYTQILEPLLRGLPAKSATQVKAIIARELGPVSSLFASFEDTPLGSGTIGQAHGATLLDGTPVVVKVCVRACSLSLSLPCL